MRVLRRLFDEENKKTDFEYVPGEIDDRTEDLKDIELNEGF